MGRDINKPLICKKLMPDKVEVVDQE